VLVAPARGASNRADRNQDLGVVTAGAGPRRSGGGLTKVVVGLSEAKGAVQVDILGKVEQGVPNGGLGPAASPLRVLDRGRPEPGGPVLVALVR
jgi:hypothetical protein